MRIETRQRKNENTSRAAFSAINRVDDRLAQHIALTHEQFAEIREDNRTLNGHVGDLRASSARTEGNVEMVLASVQRMETQRHDAQRFRVAAEFAVEEAEAVAGVEVKKKKAIAEIEDTKDQRRFRRRLIYKIVALAGTLFATAATLLTLALEHC